MRAQKREMKNVFATNTRTLAYTQTPAHTRTHRHTHSWLCKDEINKYDTRELTRRMREMWQPFGRRSVLTAGRHQQQQ